MMGFFSPAPYHILSYGTLLGTTVFHTFVNGIIAFRALPRPYFASLMAQLFPIYFSMQVALPAVLALTYTSPLNNTSGIGGIGGIGGTSGLTGVLEVSNRWTVLAPLAGAFVCAAGNLAVVGPRTTRVMELRRGQERKDGKKAYDSPPHSAAMVALNKRFSILHGISSLLNLGTLAATVVYGVTLSSRLT